jgi:hypothetical protein
LEDALEDELDVHRGLAGLAGALAVHAMLADEDEGVGKDVQGDGEAAGLEAELKLAALELFFSINEY